MVFFWICLGDFFKEYNLALCILINNQWKIQAFTIKKYRLCFCCCVLYSCHLLHFSKEKYDFNLMHFKILARVTFFDVEYFVLFTHAILCFVWCNYLPIYYYKTIFRLKRIRRLDGRRLKFDRSCEMSFKLYKQYILFTEKK